ncbi:MAG: TonB-dependent receptor [Chitinophagaceae bacterium]|nr:MAG: TonB-dependent receptor [Chitinophagaceae bacterium]
MMRLSLACAGIRMKLTTLVLVFLASSVMVFAQTSRTGKVLDDTGKPVPDVNIIVKGTTGGTTTNDAGEFTLAVSAGQTLVISGVNYETKEVLVGAEGPINISVAAKSGTLSDVVIVGYGTQKRTNLTGAVATIDKKKLENRPVQNAMAALQGVAPGVTVTRSTGQPGAEGFSLQIRGFSSVNGATPLVLIDGSPGSLISVNPNDIETISVLKDAAAASIYGARAAGGVVLVTTKRGASGKVSVTYSGRYAIQNPANVPGRLHSWEEAQMANESRINAGQSPGYTPEQIRWMQDPDTNFVRNPANLNDYLYYYDLDQTDLILRDNSPTWDHNISMRGGGQKDNYFLSLGYYKQQGVFKLGPDQADRINARFNYNLQISPVFSLETRLAYRQSNRLAPSGGNAQIFSNLYTTRTLYPTFFPGTTDRYINDNSGNFAYARLKEGGAEDFREDEGNAQFVFKAKDLVKGLTLSASYNPRLGTRTIGTASRTIPRYNLVGIASYMNNPNSYTKSEYKITSDNVQLLADYVKKVGTSHDFHLLGGYAYEDERTNLTTGRAVNLATNDFFTLNTGDPLQATATEDIQSWGLASYFARFNYAFRNKYLFEANMRYDGSSKNAKVNRWNSFPSLSVGWRLAQEDWFRNALPVFNEFKLRASWGRLGNSDATNFGNYEYVSQMAAGVPYPFNNVRSRSFYQARLASPDKVWEKIETSNIGLDLALLSNRLTFSADYFVKNNNDMLVGLQLSNSIGIQTGQYNLADLRTKGWELVAGWRDNIGANFSYYVNANIGDNTNKLISYNGQQAVLPGINFLIEGLPINTVYGYQAAGYFNDAADVAANPRFSSAVGPGDIKYVDVNKDGAINAGLGRLADHGDLVELGNSSPRYTYGFDFGFSFKGFDFSAMFQGVGQRKLFLDPTTLYPYTSSWLVPMDYNRDYWKPDNLDARFPRMFIGGAQNTVRSSHWVMNGAYLRMKNIQLGYNLPVKLISKAKLTNAKIYFSGQDLWEVSQMWLKDAFDPETPDNASWQYPFFRTVSFGINLTF